jgi:hypothetical protein
MASEKKQAGGILPTFTLSNTDSNGYTTSSTPPSIPPTPGDETDGILFAPKRAMASFENLVAMANHQERLKEARKMVWRDKGQPVVQLDSLEACLAHAMNGGLSECRPYRKSL